MGSFVALYNFIGFQLVEPPYSLSSTLVSFIFVIYVVGTFSSTFMGHLADNQGEYKVLCIALLTMFIGIVVTLDMNLVLKIIGIALLTFGFFGCHSIISSWIGKIATHDKAQASSLYLLFYYVGSSVGGTAGGTFWSSYGWHGVVGMIVCFLVLAFFISIRLSSITTVVNAENQR
jgi:YNFM family putative membrane transporter